MPQNKLSDWAKRLEAQETGDPELDLAASLKASRLPAPAPAADFLRREQRRLEQQAARLAGGSSSPAMASFGWLGAAAGLVLVVLVIALAIHLLPNPPAGNETTAPILQAPDTAAPAAMQPQESTPRLAYPCGSGSICSAEPDGSNSAILFTVPDHDLRLLSVSPDGHYLLLSAQLDAAHQPTPDATPDIPGVGRTGELYTFDLTEGALVKLARRFSGGDPATWCAAAWLTDGEVVYINEDESLQTAVYRVQPDGSGLTRLTELAPSPTHWQLVPSPDPERVYWQSSKVEDYSVASGPYFWSPLSGEQAQTLAWLPLESQGLGDVRFSPAGGLMAYLVHRDQPALYIANPDGSEPRQVWAAQNIQPAPGGLPPRFYWTPDGQSLLLEFYEVLEEPLSFTVVYRLYRVQTGEMVDLPASLNVPEDLVSEPSWKIGLAPQASPDGQVILVNHPSYAFPQLLDLQTLTVRDALTNTAQSGELSWKTVVWIP